MSISIQGRTGWSSVPNSIGRSRLPHPTVHLLLNLLTHSEGFNAGYKIITEQTGMSTDTISRALENLKKLDLISVEKRAGENGRFASNHYIFHADLLWKLSPEFVAERLNTKPATRGDKAATAPANKAGTALGDKEGTALGDKEGTALGDKAAPLWETKRKNEQEEPPLLEEQGPHGASAPQPPKGELELAQTAELEPAKEKKPAQGTRLPEGWTPDQEVIWKMQAEFPDMNLQRAHEEFVDFWISVPGAKGKKLDWNATWRNRIRTLARQGNYPRKMTTVRPQMSKADEKAAWYLQRAEEIARQHEG